MNKLRLFIAVEIEDKKLKLKLQALQEELGIHGIRTTKPDQLHFTLHFLGDTLENRIGLLQQGLASLNSPAFQIEIRGCGVFPNKKKPRVIWVDVHEGRKQIISLQQQLAKYLEHHQFPVEKRSYHPHVTLARIKSSNIEILNHVRQFIEENHDLYIGTTKINRVMIKQSTLTTQGAIYSNRIVQELANESA